MRRRAGQTTVEYMLLISVISIAVAAILLSTSATLQVNVRNLSTFLAAELTGANGGQQVQR